MINRPHILTLCSVNYFWQYFFAPCNDVTVVWPLFVWAGPQERTEVLITPSSAWNFPPPTLTGRRLNDNKSNITVVFFHCGVTTEKRESGSYFSAFSGFCNVTLSWCNTVIYVHSHRNDMFTVCFCFSSKLSPSVLKCEYCKNFAPASQFRGTKRFCSMTCAKRYFNMHEI